MMIPIVQELSYSSEQFQHTTSSSDTSDSVRAPLDDLCSPAF